MCSSILLGEDQQLPGARAPHGNQLSPVCPHGGGNTSLLDCSHCWKDLEELTSSQFRNAPKKPQQENLSDCRHGKSVKAQTRAPRGEAKKKREVRMTQRRKTSGISDTAPLRAPKAAAQVLHLGLPGGMRASLAPPALP